MNNKNNEYISENEINISNLNKLMNDKKNRIIQNSDNKIWLSYDNGNFILVKLTYINNDRKKRSFNHVSIDDSIITDNLSNIPNVFKEGIHKLEEKKCFKWISNKFVEIQCELQHT